MGKLQCDVCGSPIAILPDGQGGECTCCGAVYPITRLRIMVGATTQHVEPQTESTLEDLRTLAERHYVSGSFNDCLIIINKMLEINPQYSYACERYNELQTLKYMTVKNGIITEYTGRASELWIPPCVTAIADHVFENYSSLIKVHLPDSVTMIGGYAFSGCTSLTNINLPDTVTEIGNHAFQGCTSLTDVHIPDSMTEIGRGVFYRCESLTNIHIPNTVTKIGDSAFSYCESLTSVNIPDTMTDIGEYAFYCCNSLTSVNIPDTMTDIGDCAFCRCISLTKVTGPKYFFTYPKFSSKHWEGTPFLSQIWKNENRCQHCGGVFKGVFSSVCTKCGKKKDY